MVKVAEQNKQTNTMWWGCLKWKMWWMHRKGTKISKGNNEESTNDEDDEQELRECFEFHSSAGPALLGGLTCYVVEEELRKEWTHAGYWGNPRCPRVVRLGLFIILSLGYGIISKCLCMYFLECPWKIEFLSFSLPRTYLGLPHKIESVHWACSKEDDLSNVPFGQPSIFCRIFSISKWITSQFIIYCSIG